MFHINTVKDNDINKVVNQEIVDGQMYVDEKPVKDSPFLVTSGGVADKFKNTIDTDDEHEYVAPADGYEVGKYYIYAGVFCRCIQIDGDEATLRACGGILQTFNDLKGIIDDLTARVAALENP